MIPKGATKPPPGAQVDWGHPLSRGLAECWLFNAQGRPVPLIGGQGRAGTYPSSAPASVNEGGLRTNGNGQHVRVTIRPQTSRQATVICLAGVTSLAGNYAAFWHDRNGRPIGLNTTQPAGTLAMTFDDGQWDVTTGPTIPTDGIARLHYASVRVGMSHFGVGGNVVSRVPSTVPNSNTWGGAPTGTNGYIATDSNDTTNRRIEGTYHLIAVWNRYMNLNELAWLNAEPYGFLAPPRPRRLYSSYASPNTGQFFPFVGVT